MQASLASVRGELKDIPPMLHVDGRVPLLRAQIDEADVVVAVLRREALRPTAPTIPWPMNSSASTPSNSAIPLAFTS
jgi:hypothetical protein